MLFSVIVPVYNNENYITECINRVKCQSYTDWEAILVDDGSTDKSGILCDHIAEQDARIRVIHQKNQGAAVARNVAIDKSFGEYLVFLDADDIVDQDFLMEAEKVIEEVHPDILITNGRKMMTSVKFKPFDWNVEYNSSSEKIRKIFLCGFLGQTFRRICRRTLFKTVKFPARRMIGEDLYISIDLASQAHKYAALAGKGYCYNRTPHGSCTQKKIAYRNYDIFRCWRHFNENADRVARDKNELKCLKDIYETACLRFALLSLRNHVKGTLPNSEFQDIKQWMQIHHAQDYAKEQINIEIAWHTYRFYKKCFAYIGDLSPVWKERALRVIINLYAMNVAYPFLTDKQIDELRKTAEQFREKDYPIRLGNRIILWLMKHNITAGLRNKGKRLLEG
jgi:glycosyltransferase involved in cell wall biosynthesis